MNGGGGGGGGEQKDQFLTFSQLQITQVTNSIELK